jgi:glycopeptide antibiotics resistance protein
MNSRAPKPVARIPVFVALLAYSGIIVSLTMLKAFFMIGLLWQPENQRVRGLSLVPLNDLWESASLFTQIFGYGGNFAFFVPFGVLAYLLVGRIGATTLIGAGFSLLIEVSQYIFQLGFSDIDDLLFNTLGAAAGAFIASLFGSRAQWVWVTLTAVLTVVFIVLVILGPSLGDPDRVAEVNALQSISKNENSVRIGA